MGLLSGINSVLDSGAVKSAIDVGSNATDWLGNVGGAVSNAYDGAASSGGLWSGVTDFATEAFGWIGDNPEAANIIGGVALGGAQGYMQNQQAEDQRAFEREMYEKRNQDRFAKPGKVNNYPSHLNQIGGKGMITDGLITGEQEDRR